MSPFRVVCSLVELVGRGLLIVTAIWFLMKSLGWMQLACSLLSSKQGSNASLVDINLANLTRFNLYSWSLLTASIILILLAIYSVYVPLFSKRRGLKRLAYISSFTFIAGLVAYIYASSNLTRFEVDALVKLREYQILYRWDSGQKGGKEMPMPNKQATIIWDLVQENLDCCGFEKPSDWGPLEPDSLKRRDLLPRSCCQDLFNATIQGDGYCREDLAHWTVGCSHKVHSVITQVMSMIHSVIHYCMLVIVYASIVAIFRDCENQQSAEMIPIVPPPSYQETLDGAYTNNALIFTQEEAYLYPQLSHLPFYARYGSR